MFTIVLLSRHLVLPLWFLNVFLCPCIVFAPLSVFSVCLCILSLFLITFSFMLLHIALICLFQPLHCVLRTGFSVVLPSALSFKGSDNNIMNLRWIDVLYIHSWVDGHFTLSTTLVQEGFWIWLDGLWMSEWTILPTSSTISTIFELYSIFVHLWN